MIRSHGAGLLGGLLARFFFLALALARRLALGLWQHGIAHAVAQVVQLLVQMPDTDIPGILLVLSATLTPGGIDDATDDKQNGKDEGGHLGQKQTIFGQQLNH